ncbi:MAG: YbaB/EbfC family nucleoid-associated protein [Bacillota bacterium]|nr:YbaB/EbfC family nucleoid-associated protein [Bacillota bacterium]MDD3298327.1 YbaB/EbfC family nucleoid-associated protein [Bacillota bacterium]MDD3851688.1 YbaB/EbfC family nucleoid-associated protein [Bacillota bacterium]MDD4706773.1 YbaB/EbfC family nucleoid-associated protein [Bacillota bacterium]
MAKGKMPGMGNMGNMMKQVQKMQQEMARLQAELEERTVESSAGGGVVSVVVTGKKEIKEISIKPEAVDPDDVEMLEDLILAAVNEALRQAEEMVAGEMAKITGGLNIPGL